MIIKECKIPSFNLVNYQLIDHHNVDNPEMLLNMDVEINNCATAMGEKRLLVLNQYNRSSINVPYMRKRVSDLYIVQNHSECDTTIYTLPQGFKVEALPDAVEMESKFGAYKCKAQVDEDKITYIRYFMIKEGKHPADQYNEFRSFLEKVSAADNAKCIIAKEI